MKFIALVFILVMAWVLIRQYVTRHYTERFPPKDSGVPAEDPAPGYYPLPEKAAKTVKDAVQDIGDSGLGDAN